MKLAGLAVWILCVALWVFGTSTTRAAVKCPSGGLEDQSLIYVSKKGLVTFRDGQTTDDIPLNERLNFLYVLRKNQGAPDEGALLVKRIYDIPDDWGDVGDVVTMRRNKEREQKDFPGDIYQQFHEDVALSTIELHRGFHINYAPRERTDDSLAKRRSFLFPNSVLQSQRKLAKPLIVTWDGLGKQKQLCLDFNLNEGQGDFKRMEIYIYEIEARGGSGNPPRRTVHLTIVPKK
jgi:hypothetical protein